MADVTLHLSNANKPLYEKHIRENAAFKDRILDGHMSKRDKTVAICGAGPSLGMDAGMLHTRKPDELWACNRALPWLVNNGFQPTHAIWVDPGDAWQMEWKTWPNVTYYVSSSAQSALVRACKDKHRPFRLFHNWVGVSKPSEDWKCPLPQHPEWEYETWLYATLYPPGPCVGAGLNAVNRALGLALFQGFNHILVLGADCATRGDGTPMPPEGTDPETYDAWIAAQEFYPKGNVPEMAATDTKTCYGAEAALLEGVIDGRRWVTRPDMLISAVNLVRLKQQYGHVIELVGDTLPNALVAKDEAFLKTLPQLNENSAVTGLIARGKSEEPPLEPVVPATLTEPALA